MLQEYEYGHCYFDTKSCKEVSLKEKLTDYDAGFNFWIAECYNDATEKWQYVLVLEGDLEEIPS